MDVVILCGGKGTRLSEETVYKPKPMVEIGGMPILWHIMKNYSHFGYKRFILALGYKHEAIKKYFYEYKFMRDDFVIKFDRNENIEYLQKSDEKDWEIVFVNTGEDTLKGGRIKRIEKYIKSNSFHLTYGDGVADVDINGLCNFHNSHKSIGTVTAVRPPSRFGELKLEGDKVLDLEEKPQMGQGFINGGYFIFDIEMLNYLTTKRSCDFEFGALQKIAKNGGLRSYRHNGFWQCMDNIRERDYLNTLVENQSAPWMVWK